MKLQRREVMTEQYYEKLYKIEGQPGCIFRFVSTDKDSVLFNAFEAGDSRYWIEDEPKLVRNI
jgi:hypothetical protein